MRLRSFGWLADEGYRGEGTRLFVSIKILGSLV